MTNPLGVIIWSKINWLDIGQGTKFQNLEFEKKPISTSNIVKNYFRVLEVISSLNCELEYKSDVGSVTKHSIRFISNSKYQIINAKKN